MDSQPGQATVPHDDNQKPEAAQQPVAGAAERSAAHGSSADPAPAESALPAVPGAQQYQPEESQSFYSADASNGTPETQAASWQYAREEDPAMPLKPDMGELTWTASEFIEHPKGIGWYSLLMLAGLVVSGLNYLITRDIISTCLILAAAVIFGIYAGHKPRIREYRLSPRGLQIGDKLYVFQAFKAFSVADEGATASIVFMPLGRFAPPVTIYLARDMEDKVLEYLSNFLPLERHRSDAIDGLLRWIRF